MMDQPQTATQFNAPLTGEVRTFVATSSDFTMASGMMMQQQAARDAELRDKIEKCLRRFVQDEILIRKMAIALLEVVNK